MKAKVTYPATQEQLDTLTTLEEFRDYYASIPVEMWIKRTYHDEKTNKCCAYGHLGKRKNNHPKAVSNLHNIFPANLFAINDGNIWSPTSNKYQHLQFTTKYRVIAYFDYLINNKAN